LSDELDIVGAGVEVLVGEVVADPRATVEGARTAPDPEAVWRNPAATAPLAIGARVMWERA
jgi:hypothetical protein